MSGQDKSLQKAVFYGKWHMKEEPKLTYDIHVHVAGNNYDEWGNYVKPKISNRFLIKHFIKKLGIKAGKIEGISDLEKQIADNMKSLISGCKIDRFTLLAIDAAHKENGEIDMERSQLIVSNRFVSSLAKTSNRLLFGGSIHPYRKDALDELEQAAKDKVCLIKWLPSAQNINPSSKLCYDFYEALAHYKIPLLCHTGNEHILGAFSNKLNDPVLLKTALEMGVTVIAAHCSTKMYLYETDYFTKWKRMALEYENFYGDTGAFIIPTRMISLKSILKDDRLKNKVLYGSDFPTLNMIRSSFWILGLKKASMLHNIKNPLDQYLEVMMHLGLTSNSLTKAGSILRI